MEGIMENKMTIQVYYKLPEEAVSIRQAVFVEEQGFNEEFDSIDNNAVHLVLFDGNTPVATCRFFKDKEPGTYIIGRIAVMCTHRGKNLGSALLIKANQLIKEAGGIKICLHSQKRVKEFYEKQGYQVFGAEDFDEGCPHIWMYKEIK